MYEENIQGSNSGNLKQMGSDHLVHMLYSRFCFSYSKLILATIDFVVQINQRLPVSVQLKAHCQMRRA